MTKLRIKIKNDTTTFNHHVFVEDTYNISKENLELQKLIERTCKDSHIDDIQEVKVFSETEW